MLAFIPEISSRIYHLPCFATFGGGWPVTCSPLPMFSAFVLLPTSAGCYWFFWEVGLSPHSHSQPLCLSQPLLDASSSFGRLVCHSTPALSLYTSPNLCWVLAAPLGDWLIAPPHSQPLLLFPHFTESSASCATPILWDRFSVPPHLHCQC
jgi:hypothetical protein